MISYLIHYDTDIFPFLPAELSAKGYRMQFLRNPVNHGEYVNAVVGAWRAVRKAKKGDGIVTYMSSGGVLAFWLSLIETARNDKTDRLKSFYEFAQQQAIVGVALPLSTAHGDGLTWPQY